MKNVTLRLELKIDDMTFSKGVEIGENKLDCYGRNEQIISIYSLIKTSFPCILNILNGRKNDNDIGHKITKDLFDKNLCGYAGYIEETK